MTLTQAKQLLKKTDKETLQITLQNYDIAVIDAALALDINIETIDESYAGEWGSDEDFVQHLLEECGNIPENLPPYVHIDWERTARDIMYDYCAEDGHYFRRI